MKRSDWRTDFELKELNVKKSSNTEEARRRSTSAEIKKLRAVQKINERVKKCRRDSERKERDRKIGRQRKSPAKK